MKYRRNQLEYSTWNCTKACVEHTESNSSANLHGHRIVVREHQVSSLRWLALFIVVHYKIRKGKNKTKHIALIPSYDVGFTEIAS